MKLEFWTPGQPRGAGSKHGLPLKRNGVFTGKVAMIDSSGEAGKLWTSSIVGAAFEAAQKQNWVPVDGPVILRVEFVMQRPQKHYHTNRKTRLCELRSDAPAVHGSKPDMDKLERRLCDALTNIVWRDDSLICEKHSYKMYGEQPGCRVTVTTYSEEAILRDSIARVGQSAEPSDLKSGVSEFESPRGQ